MRTNNDLNNIRNWRVLGTPVPKTEDTINRWVEYAQELCIGKGSVNDLDEKGYKFDVDEKGEIILRSEFDKALKDSYNRKAPGVDGIPVELLRSARDEVLDRLLKLAGTIYESGELPSNFRNSIVIMLPKKKGNRKI